MGRSRLLSRLALVGLLASALAMVLVGLMALITVVHQWLLRRSYHDAR